MSDVTVAPNASPPPQNEVRVPDPAATPSPPPPIGQQAPNKPVDDASFKGSEHRPLSRREAIQKAFERSQAQAKPADAKMGHNQPPEKMEREAPKRERPKAADPEKPTIDLKKRPADQPKAEEREPQPRGEHGHFGARQDEVQRAAPGQQQQPGPGAPAHKQPIPRMSAAAKNDWGKVPETVQHDIHRLHTEFGRAYQQYRGDHEAMNVIRPFHQLAQQQGTTLAKALSNYVGMEHKLRSDVVGGLDLIVDNLNLRTPDGRKLSLQDVAWHIVNQTPEQRQLLQSKNAMMAQSHQLQAANQRIQALEQNARQVQYAAAFNQTRGAVDQFADTHPRLDELGDLIEQEVKLGFDLDTAYKRAELLRPATAAQTRNTAAQTRSTTAQTRTPDRSISGAPGGSATNGDARPKKPVGRREAIANAIKRVSASGSL
jgi:hypothetical protein